MKNMASEKEDGSASLLLVELDRLLPGGQFLNV